MRPFLRDVFLFTAIQVAVYGGLIAAFYRPLPNHYLAATIDKHKRLESTKPPRMIFVGGSGVAFGIHSPAIADAFPAYRPVNMGLHGSLHLEYMLAEVEPKVRTGDVVVTVLEYPLLVDQHSQVVDGDFYAELLVYRPDAIGHYRWPHFKALLERGLWRFSHRAFTISLRIMRGKNPDQGHAPYTRDSFNAFGDVVAHLEMEPLDIRARPAFVGATSRAEVEEAVETINEFARVCRRRGATVLLGWGPYPEEQFRQAQTALRMIESVAREKLTIPVLYRVEDSVYPTDCFFDTAYHLNRRGGALHTARLIEAIRAALR